MIFSLKRTRKNRAAQIYKMFPRGVGTSKLSCNFSIYITSILLSLVTNYSRWLENLFLLWFCFTGDIKSVTFKFFKRGYKVIFYYTVDSPKYSPQPKIQNIVPSLKFPRLHFSVHCYNCKKERVIWLRDPYSS